MAPPVPPDSVGLKEYLDSKFDGLEKLIDAKFQAVEATNRTQNKTLSVLEGRVASLERWRAYVCGACLVLGFLARWVWDKLSSF